MAALKITPVPFRSSNLAIPPSPFSPRSPLTPLPRPNRTRYNYRLSYLDTEPPEIHPPLQWMWQCHQCRQNYPLGATLRCLEDGHEFCAGTSLVRSRKDRNQKSLKKHRACASEFDYAAWKTLGEWRRLCIIPRTSSAKYTKDCWRNCDYPSECRWGSTTAAQQSVALQVSSTTPVSPLQEKSTRDTPYASKQQKPPAITLDTLLAAVGPSTTWWHSQTLTSGKKRTEATQKLPLKLHPVFEVVDEDGDAIMRS